jgi:hypothetical protein
VLAPGQSEQRLNGIAISWGGCDFPAFRVRPAWLKAQDASSRLLAMIALLTVAAIRQKDSRDDRF